ncbi:MAG TPA: ABC transporter ATP-binding protein [Actinomycetales bacterium]|nr:ABC transporter ATP-binding protein [Actinomycetales bacterium]
MAHQPEPARSRAHRAGTPGPEPSDAAVSLRDVTRLFDGLPAISAVSLDVVVGETVWLRGPNGSGKSTLLRVVATALSPTFGTGTVLGDDLVRARDRIRARVEYLGHQTRLYADLTAAENLRFTCALYGLDPRAVPGALAMTGLDAVGDVRVGAFSQGMRQRLALARAAMRDADLLLLDEPYAGLDVDARAIVDDLLTRARTLGRTVLLASHEAPADGLVDRAVELDAGRVVLPVRERNRPRRAPREPVREALRETVREPAWEPVPEGLP